jgi:sugar lactone lactonase YvrE
MREIKRRLIMRNIKLLGLCAVLVLLALAAASSSAVTLGAGLQPPPGKGTVYITKVAPAPDGAIMKPLDLGLGILTSIVSGLAAPFDLLCGPDGRLYVTERWAVEKNQPVNRILRFNQDGSGRTLVAQWPASELQLSGMAFAPNGDLYFGTMTIQGQEYQPTQGIWRIPGALQADQQFNPPEQILPPHSFRKPTRSDSVRPVAFLTSGPFQGDLLIIDVPSWTGTPGGRVLRAPKPEFNTLVEFIPAHNNPAPFFPQGLALNSQGDVFVTDHVNKKILRYEPDGTRKGIFAEITGPMQIAIGPDDLAYITVWQGSSAGALLILAPDGKSLGSAQFPMRMYGVTVCAPQ